MIYKSTTGKLLAILIVSGMASCGQQAKEETTEKNEAFEQTTTDIKDKIESVVYDIPPPSEIPFLLEASGAEYNEELVNSIDKKDVYEVTNDKAAMNLGVYATDIGYLVSYEKVQEALNYMSSTKSLADHIGVSAAVDAPLLERFESNLGNKSELANILNEAIDKADEFLKNDDRQKIASLLVSGSFVEGLYISTELVNSYPKDILPDDSRLVVLTPLIRVILDQEKSLADLLSLLNSLDQEGNVQQLTNHLSELKGLYEKLNIDEQIKNNESNLVLSDETLLGITAKVREIRSFITE